MYSNSMTLLVNLNRIYYENGKVVFSCKYSKRRTFMRLIEIILIMGSGVFMAIIYVTPYLKAKKAVKKAKDE